MVSVQSRSDTNISYSFPVNPEPFITMSSMLFSANHPRAQANGKVTTLDDILNDVGTIWAVQLNFHTYRLRAA
ncbi:hypothetical protein XENTR_v10015084 [Xenopus tropicalis]|nr:hypothetical protein XENTR_v10015084 [Xenopus tropicalis]